MTLPIKDCNLEKYGTVISHAKHWKSIFFENLILGMGVSLGHNMFHIVVKTFFKVWCRICFCSHYKEGGRTKRGCCPLINIGPSSPNCWLSYTNTNPPSTIGFIPFLLALVSVIEKQKKQGNAPSLAKSWELHICKTEWVGKVVKDGRKWLTCHLYMASGKFLIWPLANGN